MFIEKISIESFGSLSSVSYELTEGINIFRGQNECGKSTLAAFIKFIFYGLCGKLPDQSMTEKTRYTNWDSGISGGNLIINDGGRRYRIERRVTPAAKASGKETVRIVDLASGAEVHKDKCPGEVFFGVSEEVFSQTAFSAQGSGSVVDSEKMNNAIDNILFSANESVSVRSALKKLDEARVFLLHKNQKGGKIYSIDRELEDLEARIEKAEANEAFLEAKSRTLEEGQKQREANRQLLRETQDKLTHFEAESILARFAELDRKKEAYRKTLAEGTHLRDDCTVKGFLPDYAYRDSLKTLHADIGFAESEVASLTAQKEAFSLTSLSSEQHTVLKATEAAGGKEEAVKKLLSLTAKRKGRIKTAVILAVLTVVLTAVSLVFAFTDIIKAVADNPVILYAMFGVSAALLVATVVTACSISSLKTGELYAAFLAENEAQAIRNIETALEADRLVREEDARYARLSDALAACKNKKKALEENAASLLNRWGYTYTDRDSVTVVIDNASDAIARLEQAALAIKNARMAFESAESALVGFSREEYEEKRSRTAYVGTVHADSVEDLKRKLSFYRKKEEALETQIRSAELEIASRSAVTENADELKETLSETEALREEYVNKYKAYVLAYEAIRKSSQRLRERISPALSQSASELMKASTQGRYTDIGIDNTLAVSFRADEASPSREVGFMSAGTKALTYISLRLSLIRLLFRGKMPPTVFDEAFSWLDGERLASMMSLLSIYSRSAQVIVMTCCDREYEACADKASVNLIDIKSDRKEYHK